jgi:hypothetical protein
MPRAMTSAGRRRRRAGTGLGAVLHGSLARTGQHQQQRLIHMQMRTPHTMLVWATMDPGPARPPLTRHLALLNEVGADDGHQHLVRGAGQVAHGVGILIAAGDLRATRGRGGVTGGLRSVLHGWTEVSWQELRLQGGGETGMQGKGDGKSRPGGGQTGNTRLGQGARRPAATLSTHLSHQTAVPGAPGPPLGPRVPRTPHPPPLIPAPAS